MVLAQKLEPRWKPASIAMVRVKSAKPEDHSWAIFPVQKFVKHALAREKSREKFVRSVRARGYSAVKRKFRLPFRSGYETEKWFVCLAWAKQLLGAQRVIYI